MDNIEIIRNNIHYEDVDDDEEDDYIVEDNQFEIDNKEEMIITHQQQQLVNTNNNIEFLEKTIYSQYMFMQFSEVSEISKSIIHSQVEGIVNLFKKNPDDKRFTNKIYLYATLMSYISCITSSSCSNCNNDTIVSSSLSSSAPSTSIPPSPKKTEAIITHPPTTPIKTIKTTLPPHIDSEEEEEEDEENDEEDEDDYHDDEEDEEDENVEEKEEGKKGEEKKEGIRYWRGKKEFNDIVNHLKKEFNNIEFWKHIIKLSIIKLKYKNHNNFIEYSKQICNTNNLNFKCFFNAFCYFKTMQINRKFTRSILNYYKKKYLKNKNNNNNNKSTKNWYDNNNVLFGFIKYYYKCDINCSLINNDDICKYIKYITTLKGCK